MLKVIWEKCQNNTWCSFKGVNLENSHFNNMKGVYIIWQVNGSIIRVGQGIIKDRVASHRDDLKISKYNNLNVTWAKVGGNQRDGVERYLANELKPKVGAAFPDVDPIEVNLPWKWN